MQVLNYFDNLLILIVVKIFVILFLILVLESIRRFVKCSLVFVTAMVIIINPFFCRGLDFFICYIFSILCEYFHYFICYSHANLILILV